MSDTPITDRIVAGFSCPEDAMIDPDTTRKIEKENTALREANRELVDYIKSEWDRCQKIADSSPEDSMRKSYYSGKWEGLSALYRRFFEGKSKALAK